jgi:hypothetical protein
MADAKIEIKVGSVSFSGEGDGKWLSEQLDKVIEKLPELANVAPAESEGDRGGGHEKHIRKGKKGNIGTLAAFLKEKNASGNQVKKFLATAVWLHDSTGQDRVTTGEVKTALKNFNQVKLTNAANCLNQNVGKGHSEKDGSSGFFVTEAGRTSLG